MTRSIRALALAAAVTALAAPAAFGHAEVKKLSPQPGTTVPRSLSVVTVSLSEGVLGGKLVVRNAAGTTVSRRSSLVNDKRTLRAPLKTLHKGRYTARATWLADDGDKQRKTWSFRVR